MLIHRISFVLVSVGSLELCGSDAVSENFISIGFRGESVLKCCFRDLSSTLPGNKSGRNAEVFRGIHESGLADPVTSDCRFTVLDRNFWSILAFSHLSEPPAQILPSPTHTLTHFIKHSLMVFSPKPWCSHYTHKGEYLSLFEEGGLDLKAILFGKDKERRFKSALFSPFHNAMFFIDWKLVRNLHMNTTESCHVRTS